MNFLLIDIGYDCNELNEPLGIEVISSFLKKEIPYIHIDSYYSNIDGFDYCSAFKKYKPDIVGVSTHINTWMRFDNLYIEYLCFCKKNKKSPILLVGGILGTYEYETVLNKYANVICTIGEGEESILRLLKVASPLINLSYEALLSCLEFGKCVNIAYKRNNQIVTSKRTYMPSFDNLIFPVEHRYLKPTLDRNGLARIEASRGCPWNRCSFCVLNWKYACGGWRPFPLEKIISEIIDVSSQGANTIYFTDEEFIAGDYQRVQSFIFKIQSLKSQGIIKKDLEFVASTSVQALLGKYGMSRSEVEECIFGLKRIGFRSFFLGIESGCDSQLLRFQKGSTAKENEEAIALLKKNSFEMDIGYILFDPLLSVKELCESLKFLDRNGLSSHISRFAKRLRLVPHTAYCNLFNINFEYYDSNSVEIVYKFNDPKIQKIYDCYSYWEEKHLCKAYTIQAEIRSAESSSKERNVKIEKLRTVRYNEFEVLSQLVLLAQKMPNFCDTSINVIISKIQTNELML